MEARPRLRPGPGTLARAHGAAGEDEAARYLEARGFRLLARNFRTRAGEVDIVAREGPVTVFVEVKRRESQTHGIAAEFVTPAKRQRVIAAARAFAARHGLSQTPLRFDVIAIDVIDGKPRVSHHRGAFDAR